MSSSSPDAGAAIGAPSLDGQPELDKLPENVASTSETEPGTAVVDDQGVAAQPEDPTVVLNLQTSVESSSFDQEGLNPAQTSSVLVVGDASIGDGQEGLSEEAVGEAVPNGEERTSVKILEENPGVPRGEDLAGSLDAEPEPPAKARQKEGSIPPGIKAISGSLGGVVEAVCLQPIDVIKTRLQLDSTGQYRGILHCGRTIVHNEGVRALWKGLTPFATHLTLKYSLRMGTNAVFQSALRSNSGQLDSKRRMLAGFGAGVVEALAIVTPFEVVKIRLQQQRGLATDNLKYKGPLHCAGTIIREEGVRGLWAGAWPTVMRNGTNQAVMFTAKHNFDKLVWGKNEGDGTTLKPWQSMISGFAAGFSGPVATGPFDVVKTRLMAQERSGPNGEPPKYRGMFHCISRIAAEEGIPALWKGLLPRLMRIPPGQAIVWAVADQLTGVYERSYASRQ